MPHVSVHAGTECKPVYQVGGKSFVFFRNPRPDAFDPDTGQRYDDVLVFWVPKEGRQTRNGAGRLLALLQYAPLRRSPSVLLRASRLGDISYAELAEVVQEAWLCRVSARRRAAWLAQHPPD
jgi:hypothetical protein